MHVHARVAFLAAMILLALPHREIRAEQWPQGVTLENQSDWEVVRLLVKRASSSAWDAPFTSDTPVAADGMTQIKAGTQLAIKFREGDNSHGTCRYDVRLRLIHYARKLSHD